MAFRRNVHRPISGSSGMASFASGALDQARKIAKHNIALLADAVRQGLAISSATEPAAVPLL